MGLGTFGGGLGAVRFLVARGASVTVTDLRPESALARSLEQLAETPPARFRLGGHDPRDFEEADLVVVSPAVPRDSPWLERARAAGVPITSEIELFWQLNRGRVLAITGSNGKSTTTALAHALLTQAWRADVPCASPESGFRPARVWRGGNIGHSLLPEVDAIQPTDWVVLELSSFQLETLAPLGPRPQIAVVTNFSPNHLDRHGTLTAYRAAKQTLLNHQAASDWSVRNADDPDVAHWPSAARPLWFSLHDRAGEGVFWQARQQVAIARSGGREWQWPLREWTRLPGEHNLANLLAALAATLPGDPRDTELREAIQSFPGLPHRLEEVARRGELRFVNDSKSTTPAASALAVASFNQPVVLLAGGYDKQIDLAPLAECATAGHVCGVAWLGQTGPQLATLLERMKIDRPLPRRVCSDLPSAVTWAIAQLPRDAQGAPRGVVLLSPGSASYDWFENYEARGEQFRALAREWLDHSATCPDTTPERGP